MRGHFARNRAVLLLTFFSLIGACLFVHGQFRPSEIAQREQWEEFLKTADIVKSEPIGEGVTAPTRLYLKKGEIEKKGAWKNPSGMMYGFLEGWQYEIAAYRMDKLLGLNMIPPTIEREFKGKAGSLSLWADSKTSLLKLADQGQNPPPSTDNAKYLTRAFDCLIANDDRTQQNILYTEDWRTILIDHSRSFRSDGEFTEKLMYGAHSIKKFQDGRLVLFRRLPRAFVEKVKALDFATIKNAMGPYLKEKEIDAVLARKKLFLDEIDEMIKQQGEDKVLY
jgi:hypothetical protein